MGNVTKCEKCGSENVIPGQTAGEMVCGDCAHRFSSDVKKRRVFISYGRDQYAEFADQIKKSLQEHGYQVWFDLERIKGGTDWEKYIEDGLSWVAESPVRGKLCLLMTPHSVRRPDGFCLNEISRAVQLMIPIIPVMVVWCEPPLSICRIQWLDVQDCLPVGQKPDVFRMKLERLVEAIEEDEHNEENVQSRFISLFDPLPFDADIAGHVSGFIGREWIFDHISAWLSDGKASRLFWIAGPPGIGKTAIASMLCYRYREVGAYHFCRFGHMQRTDPRRFVLSIAYQLSTQLPAYRDKLKDLRLEQIVNNSDARTVFDLLIAQPLSNNFPHPDRNILVVVDALDEATCDNTNEIAGLIAAEFPKTPGWLRLFVTSRYDQEVAHLFQGYKPFMLNAAMPENRSDIHRYLMRELEGYYEKGDIPAPVIDAIVARSEGNFLYAERVNQELAQGNLTLDKIENFPQGLGGVYAQYFKRQFSDLKAYKSAVRPLLEVIAVAQEPLDAAFLASLFGWDEYESEEALGALGSLFPVIDGAIRPFHRSLTDWITNKDRAGPYYVSAREGHRRLADFGLQAYKKGAAHMSPYLLAYVPFHMISLGLWDDLRTVLTDPAFFDLSWSLSQHNIKSFWRQIEAHSALRAVDVYRNVREDPAQFKSYFVWKIAILLADLGHGSEAVAMYEYLIEHYRRSGDFANLQACIGNLSILAQKNKGTTADGQAGFVCGPDNKNALIAALNGQANDRFLSGELDKAMDLFNEVERLCRETGDKHELSVCLNNRARIFYIQGKGEMAMQILRDIEGICREVNNFNGLSIALNNQALIRYESGDLDVAMDLFKESERISREQSNKNGLLISLNNEANILYDHGELDGALKLYKEVEELSRELDFKAGLHIAIGNQALVMYDRGDAEGSLKLHGEEEKICRDLGDKVGLECTLNARGVVYYDLGDPEGAMRLFKEAEALCRDLGHKVGLQNSLGNQALVLSDMGDLEGALRLQSEEEAICRDIGNINGLQIALCNRAGVLLRLGRPDEATALFSAAGQEFRRLNNIAGEQVILNGEALALYEKGDAGTALERLKRASGICRRIGLRRALPAALGNQAVMMSALGDAEGALETLKEVERICREIRFPEGLAIALADQAIIDARIKNDAAGARDKALDRAREACRIAEDGQNKALAEQMRSVLGIVETGKAADGGEIKTTPRPITWPLKTPKLEKK